MEPKKDATTVICGMEMSYYWENSVTLNGITYVPNATVAYVEFCCAHTIPVATQYKTMLHPDVVARFYRTMLHQQFNLNHQLRVHEKNKKEEDRKIKKDRIIGAVMDVWFPSAPEGVYRISRDKATAPGIRGVASLFKQADGADKLIGGHQSGRREMSVSMEMDFDPSQSGFVIDAPNPIEGHGSGTPNNLRDAGYLYVPATQAPVDLLQCWNKKKGMIDQDWRGKPVYMLCGGLDSWVHFGGLGMVDIPMEKEAEIVRLAAGKGAEGDVTAEDVAEPLEKIITEIGKIV